MMKWKHMLLNDDAFHAGGPGDGAALHGISRSLLINVRWNKLCPEELFVPLPSHGSFQCVGYQTALHREPPIS